MTATLCTVPACAKPGTHATDCTPDPEHPCTGCLPGLAADGLLICTHHRRAGERNLRELPGLDDDLVRATVHRTQAVNIGFITDGQAATGIVLNEGVMEAKAAIRETLTKLVAYVAHERGVAPADVTHTRTMTSWLLPHLDWLSANPASAPHWPDAVRQARGHARAKAYPVRPDGTYLGTCTTPLEEHDEDGHVTAQGPCGGPVRFTPSDYSGDQTATCPRCGTTKTVGEWETELAGELDNGTLYTVDQLVRSIAVRQGKVVPASTIRRWALEERITRHGKDERGRTLYDPAEVLRVAADVRGKVGA